MLLQLYFRLVGNVAAALVGNEIYQVSRKAVRESRLRVLRTSGEGVGRAVLMPKRTGDKSVRFDWASVHRMARLPDSTHLRRGPPGIHHTIGEKTGVRAEK